MLESVSLSSNLWKKQVPKTICLIIKILPTQWRYIIWTISFNRFVNFTIAFIYYPIHGLDDRSKFNWICFWFSLYLIVCWSKLWMASDNYCWAITKLVPLSKYNKVNNIWHHINILGHCFSVFVEFELGFVYLDLLIFITPW